MRLVYFTLFLLFLKILAMLFHSLAWGEGYLIEWKPDVDYFPLSLFNFVHIFLNYQWINIQRDNIVLRWALRKSKNTCIFAGA